MAAGYEGVTIDMKVSGVRPGEAANRAMTVEEADERIRELLKRSLERKYPGAAVNVQTAGDRPVAEISRASDLRQQQIIKSAAEHIGLEIKWDFSMQGLGLKESYS